MKYISITFVGVAVMAGILIMFVLYVAGSSLTSLLLILIALTLILPLLYSLGNNRLSLLEPLVLSNIAFGVMFLGRPLSNLFTGNTIHMGYDVFAVFDKALFIAFFGIIFFQLGYFSPVRFILARRFLWPADFQPKSAACVGWIVFLFGALLFGIFLRNAGGILNTLLMFLRGRHSSHNEIFLSSNGYFYNGLLLWVACALIFFAISVVSKRKIYMFMFLSVALLLIIFYGAQGERALLLPLFMSVSVFWLLWKNKKPNMLVILIGLIFVISILGWMREIRTAGYRENIFNKLAYSLSSPFKELGDILTGPDASMYDTLANELMVVPSHLPFQHGAIFSDILIRMVPRSLWPEKPIESNETLLRILWPVHSSLTRAGPSASIIGYLYLDSGIITVAIGMFIIGSLLSAFWIWLQQYMSSITAMLLYSMGISFVLILLRGTIPDTLTRMLFMFFPLLLLRFIKY